MKCEICGINEATIMYMKVTKNEKIPAHVCEECFEKIDVEELYCDVCGARYSDFLKNGFIGCENCYRVFKKQTIKLFKDKIINREKIGINMFKENSDFESLKKEKLKKQLKNALDKEDKNEIKRLKKELQDLGERER